MKKTYLVKFLSRGVTSHFATYDNVNSVAHVLHEWNDNYRCSAYVVDDDAPGSDDDLREYEEYRAASALNPK